MAFIVPAFSQVAADPASTWINFCGYSADFWR